MGMLLLVGFVGLLGAGVAALLHPALGTLGLIILALAVIGHDKK